MFQIIRYCPASHLNFTYHNIVAEYVAFAGGGGGGGGVKNINIEQTPRWYPD